VDFDFIPGADGTKVFKPKELITAPFLFQVLKTVEYPEMGYSRHYRFLGSSWIIMGRD
jgi:type I restriction enzyme S subunit